MKSHGPKVTFNITFPISHRVEGTYWESQLQNNHLEDFLSRKTGLGASFLE